ncbi:hypothetical protein GOODEAATRI_031286 [Goodea atripinnis]|uniref:Uncharacterized protein n=1 Tax=Goodea atripinnis TaxID=208336 RepID=A0ABV0P0T6_9TELE
MHTWSCSRVLGEFGESTAGLRASTSVSTLKKRKSKILQEDVFNSVKPPSSPHIWVTLLKFPHSGETQQIVASTVTHYNITVVKLHQIIKLPVDKCGHESVKHQLKLLVISLVIPQ